MQVTTGNVRHPAPFSNCLINRLSLKFVSTSLRISDVYDASSDQYILHMN